MKNAGWGPPLGPHPAHFFPLSNVQLANESLSGDSELPIRASVRACVMGDP